MRVHAWISAALILSSFALAGAVVDVAPPPNGEAVDLVAVRDQVRKLRTTLPKGEPIEIRFAPGTYFVTNTLSLYRADGNTLWRAATPGTAVISGGIEIPRGRFAATKLNGVDVLVAEVSDILQQELEPWPKEFRRPPAPWLYRNGMPLDIARWPNGGEWATFSNAVVSAQQEADGAKGDKRADSIVFTCDRASRWNFDDGIWFYGYWCHDWSESFVRGASYDAATGVLRFLGRHQYGFGGKTWGFAKRRFFALNSLLELDAPGEWFLDRKTRRLYVVPQADEKSAKYVLAVMTRPFIKADGLCDVDFVGLSFGFSHANTAVQLDNSRNVRVANCSFEDFGGKAIQLTGRDSSIERCRFDWIGAACIVVAGGDRKTLQKGNLAVDGCDFRRWARFERTYNPGVLLRGCGNCVRNSSFREAPHNAILINGNDQLVESNEFDRVLMETGDAGAIYMGRNPSELGTVVRGNWFHDLGEESKRDYTSAVYFDDCAWGGTVESNRFERVGRGVLVGGGNLFRIDGNSFSECRIAIHVDSRGKAWKRWTEDPEWFAKAIRPFLGDEWRAAYPELESTLGDDPAAPWNNKIRGNVFRSNARDFLFDSGTKAVANRMTICNCADFSWDSGRLVPVHGAKVVREGAASVRLRMSSAEWSCGLRVEPRDGRRSFDFSSAKWLSVDVENLSKTRQSRLTMHISAGVAEGDSGDHATAIAKKNRSVNTGIGLNPGEKGTMRLLLTHPSIYGAPEGARGPYVIDTSHVTSIHFQMQWPYEDEVADLADMRISNLRLEGEPDVSRRVDPAKYIPFVDKYGQFAHADWRFKVKSDDAFAKDLAAELSRLKSAPAQWDRYGGWKDGPKLKATGSFRTEKVNGKWWLVTPEGHLFFSVGLDVTRIMTDITDGNRHPDWYQGEFPPDGKMAFTIWNLERKFGKKDFANEYYDLVLRRFDSWGLNTIGNWSAPELGMKSRKPYVVSVLERAKGVKRHGKFHIYDFEDPGFERGFRAAIREKFATDPALARAAKDPMCIGFFIDNELQFQKWIPDVGNERAAPLVDLYFRICREELSKAAPGKLYLGSRFVGFRQAGMLWRTAAKYCDVVTVNAYANSVYNLSEKMFVKGAEKPILVGEFHFGCLDRGMFKPGLVPVCDQQERARSYTRFVEGCLQHPLIVGCHWFQYRDQPLLGRGDGEAYQIGFVDVCDRPYPELTRAARAIGETMYDKRRNGVW